MSWNPKSEQEGNPITGLFAIIILIVFILWLISSGGTREGNEEECTWIETEYGPQCVDFSSDYDDYYGNLDYAGDPY